ncbi:3-oxoadipate enol-lactonase [Mongoliitalea daihaiensis]|uniref:3-oxoadipate enol-lactonase n=1 Tax=Mongoliitalea daihaiensis TaxID=2782006 RepID=UPI001F1D91D0|nr:3-oxoadipate enol-lactonase [Mongoliitalea daihaiensis]UJP64944.1 3-oxoadipate enol-lactonase [Mongoliitalea daihaiensis]
MQAVRIHDTTIHYAYNKGEKNLCLVFINSLGTDFRIWDAVIDGLGTEFGTLRFDKRGHGLSSLGAVEKGSISSYAADVIGLCEVLDLDKIVLVGLSIGGLISLDIYQRYPDKIAGIVFMDTAPKIGTAEAWNNRIQAISTKGMQAVAPSILTNWFSPSFQEQQPAAFALYQAMLERADVLGYRIACEAIRDADYTETAQGIAIPVICMVGEEDKSTPVALVQGFAQLMNCSLITIPNAGHLPCVDSPKRTTVILQDFISAL